MAGALLKVPRVGALNHGDVEADAGDDDPADRLTVRRLLGEPIRQHLDPLTDAMNPMGGAGVGRGGELSFQLVELAAGVVLLDRRIQARRGFLPDSVATTSASTTSPAVMSATERM